MNILSYFEIGKIMPFRFSYDRKKTLQVWLAGIGRCGSSCYAVSYVACRTKLADWNLVNRRVVQLLAVSCLGAYRKNNSNNIGGANPGSHIWGECMGIKRTVKV